MNLVTDDHYMDLYERCQLMNNTFHLAGMWIIYTATMKVFLESSVVCGLVHAVYCVQCCCNFLYDYGNDLNTVT